MLIPILAIVVGTLAFVAVGILAVLALVLLFTEPKLDFDSRIGA